MYSFISGTFFINNALQLIDSVVKEDWRGHFLLHTLQVACIFSLHNEFHLAISAGDFAMHRPFGSLVQSLWEINSF